MFIFHRYGGIVHSFLLSLITIFSFFSSINCQAAQSLPLYTICLGPSNDEATADYNSNLDKLLDSLPSIASINTFHNNTSNGIYSLYLCRGDVSTQDCEVCVKNAVKEIRRGCPSNKTAIIWYDQCMVHYSNANFFGVLQKDVRVFMTNVQNNSILNNTDFGALAGINTLLDTALLNQNMYAAEVFSGANGKHKYGLVQCSRDLSTEDCSSCFSQSMQDLQACCQGKIGWRIFTPSCSIRYENYSFFEIASPTPQPTAPLSDDNEKIKIVIITLSSVAAVAAIMGFSCYFFAWRKRKGKEEILLGRFKGTNKEVLEGGLIAIDEDHGGEMHYMRLATIQAATNYFAGINKLGEGGFGPVYKGELPDGKKIAVKRLSLKSNQGLEEFRNEVILIIKLQHKNLVRLLGYCLEGDEKLLVYEYMANTSLDAFLFDPTKCKELDWEKRANIINGTARGLLYLHEDSRPKIIHRDMKASNVLLDDEMNPKISDFGTARIFGNNQSEASTQRVVGTFGYMAPEYALEGLFSMKSDVYSFGILMLEIISGKKNRGFYQQHELTQNLLSYAWQAWNEGRGLELIDPNVINGCPVDEALRWIHIALLCSQDDPADRPTMSQVVLMLASKSIHLSNPSTPPYSAAGFITLSDQSSSTIGSGISSSTTDPSSTGIST